MQLSTKREIRDVVNVFKLRGSESSQIELRGGEKGVEVRLPKEVLFLKMPIISLDSAQLHERLLD